MSHTKGKLTADHAMLFDMGGKEVGLILGRKEVFLPNARRLSACWNRFEGVSTDDVESITRVENKLRKERDEAMDVLRKVVEWNKEYPAGRVFSHHEIIRIAKKMDDINSEALAILAKYPKVES